MSQKSYFGKFWKDLESYSFKLTSVYQILDGESLPTMDSFSIFLVNVSSTIRDNIVDTLH